MAGREDASGGIVFRFAEGHYYVGAGQRLENNFRLYSYDRGRHQMATANVQPPALGQWHTIRVVAVGDHIQAYLNGALLLDHRDSRYRAGQVGLWTKADSITAFDDLVIRDVPGTERCHAYRCGAHAEGEEQTMTYTMQPLTCDPTKLKGLSEHLIAMPLVPEAWMAIALWLLRAFFVQMDAPTSQSYTMAVVAPAEQIAMASATTVTQSAGIADGPSVGTGVDHARTQRALPRRRRRQNCL